MFLFTTGLDCARYGYFKLPSAFFSSNLPVRSQNVPTFEFWITDELLSVTSITFGYSLAPIAAVTFSM